MGHDWGAVIAYGLAGAGGPMEGKIASLVTMAVPHNAVAGIAAYPLQVTVA